MSNTSNVVVIDAEEFLGDYDSMRYHPLWGFGDAEKVMAGVYSSDFWEWLLLEARELAQKELGESSSDAFLALHHRHLGKLNNLAFELRNTMEAYVERKLSELGYQKPLIKQLYFNMHHVFVRLGN